jgi:CRP-like cAMP-binding protein
MAEEIQILQKKLPFLGDDLLNAFAEEGTWMELEAGVQLIFNRLDQRICDYLEELSTVKNTRILDIRHRQIAQDLGTAREVITRTLKKLEKEGKIRQTERGIELIQGK